MATLSNNLVANSGICGNSNYYCEMCDYMCYKKYNWGKHLTTSKHMKATNGNSLATEKWQKLQNKMFCCENCGKEYNDRTGLWRHNKICVKEYKNTINNNKSEVDKDELIKTLIEQNAKLMTILENGTNNTINTTTHTNSHNKAFNLNFFLNETCKNAMNITDFVDSIKLQLSDLMEVGEIGYVEGISKIIVNNLNNLDETIRPIHCTDKKRETFYIKDENHWEKEDDEKKKIKKVIKNIANKNIRLLPQFREKYPEYNNSSSKISDKHDKMVIEAMGGTGNDDIEKEEKIIKNISKATTISNKGL
jgi:hypothetical protein